MLSYALLFIGLFFVVNVTSQGKGSRFGISSGTTWCGLGNISRSADVAEGYYKTIDRCCMIHDHCPDTIARLSYKHGYFNFRPWTISDCECDEEFRLCLKASYLSGDVQTQDKATRIGRMFFDNSQNVCFRIEKRRVCKQFFSWLTDDCSEGYVYEDYLKIYELAIFE